MKMIRRLAAPAYFFAAVAAFGAAASVNPQAYLEDVRFLASKELKGRGAGTPELEQAASFLEARYRQFGLQPVSGFSYLQAFSVTTNARLGPANRVRFTLAGHETRLNSPDDFQPFNFSSSGKLTGRLVFAGYGITAPEYHYDDYAGLDVKGKVVVLLRHEPQEFDDKSIFLGRAETQHAQYSSKATNARLHGAIGVIVIADRTHHRGETEELERFGATAGPMDCGIPFIQVMTGKVDAWFTAAGKRLDDLELAIDQDLKPRSFAFPENLQVDANVDLLRVVKTVHNVAAYLPGTSDEYVIVGGHYDHLGLGEQFSMAPSLAGTVHPGADDNASGASGVIELARWFSTQPRQRRGILFLNFAGEELGLLGSSFYVQHPELPLEKAVAMINLDMIGRVREGRVYVGGADTGTTLRPLLDRLAPKYAFKLDYSDTTGYGSSDHASFNARQVPVLFFFSGLHSDYHKPSDTWDKIDAGEAARLLNLVSELADELRQNPGRPQFVKVAPPAQTSTASGPGYGAYFGSIPDFGEGQKGFKFSDVKEGSPAAQAGFKGGDIMVEFDGKQILNLYDFTYALRAKKPGDAVLVKVMRDGKAVEGRVVLTKRQ